MHMYTLVHNNVQWYMYIQYVQYSTVYACKKHEALKCKTLASIHHATDLSHACTKHSPS